MSPDALEGLRFKPKHKIDTNLSERHIHQLRDLIRKRIPDLGVRADVDFELAEWIATGEYYLNSHKPDN